MKTEIIPIEIFDRDVMVFIGTKDELLEHLGKYNFDGEEDIRDIELPPTGNAFTIKLPLNAIIYAESKPTIPIMAHEVVHTSKHIMDIVGMQVNDETEELLAHLVKYLLDRILTLFYELPCESQ